MLAFHHYCFIIFVLYKNWYYENLYNTKFNEFIFYRLIHNIIQYNITSHCIIDSLGKHLFERTWQLSTTSAERHCRLLRREDRRTSNGIVSHENGTTVVFWGRVISVVAEIATVSAVVVFSRIERSIGNIFYFYFFYQFNFANVVGSSYLLAEDGLARAVVREPGRSAKSGERFSGGFRRAEDGGAPGPRVTLARAIKIARSLSEQWKS